MNIVSAAAKVIELDGYVPLADFGGDHWSTLAYMETVMVDMHGFQIGLDARMRSNRRSFRVMREECPRPRRATYTGDMAAVMDREKHGTLLRDGRVVANHDDFHCIQDMAAVGFFQIKKQVGTLRVKTQDATADDIEPGVTLHLSPLGRTAVELLRSHKASGGTYRDFSFKGAA